MAVTRCSEPSRRGAVARPTAATLRALWHSDCTDSRPGGRRIDMATLPSSPWTTTAADLWGIVLTGERRGSEPGDGIRMREAIGRARDLIPACQLVAVSPREAAFAAELSDVQCVAQPMYRGSAAEVFLPLLMIARRDPAAIVAVFPGTGGGHYGPGFM